MSEWRGEYDCYAQSLDDDYYHDFFTDLVKPKIETPLNNNGVVDHTGLAKAVLKDTPKDHYWGALRRNHHWQWPDFLYPNIEEPGKVNPSKFRELSINKERLPLSFERRIHIATKYPTPPEDDVMAEMIESDSAANRLFRTAREIIQWQRQVRRRRLFVAHNPYVLARYNGIDINGKQITRQAGRSYSRGYRLSLSRYLDVPPAFRVVETGGSPHQVAEDLGRALGDKALRLAYAEAA